MKNDWKYTDNINTQCFNCDILTYILIITLIGIIIYTSLKWLKN